MSDQDTGVKPSPLEVHDRLYAAFEALDLEAVYALVDEHVIYQNMAQPAVHGRAALREMWDGGFANLSHLRLKILNRAVNGDVVINERLDHWIVDGRDIHIPMAASLTVKDGLIVEWREYYDMATLERQLGRTHPGSLG
jgi:limonene-1,2-epoxide hydrolase